MMGKPVEILPFAPELAADFRSINKEWISTMFALEEQDRRILDDPQGYVIDPGGQIWFARAPELGIVGTCALLRHGPDVYELTKMGVLARARGLKIGEKLLKHVLEQASTMSFNMLFLLTNQRCEAAIHLYLKNGFVHCPDVMANYAAEYERCDVAMRFAP